MFQPYKMHEADAYDLLVSHEGQFLELGQALEVLQPGVREVRVGDNVEPSQLPQTADIPQPRIGDVRPAT